MWYKIEENVKECLCGGMAERWALLSKGKRIRHRNLLSPLPSSVDAHGEPPVADRTSARGGWWRRRNTPLTSIGLVCI